MIQPVLGIDIAKETFDVALTINDKTRTEHFQNDPDGFKSLSRWVGKYTHEVVHACMEATGQYGDNLAEYLYQLGWQVSVINPARIKAYANCKLRRNKTDKADAQLIAEYCLREKPALWSPPPASFRDLQALKRRLDDLQNNRQQESNRLQSGVTTERVVISIQTHLISLDEEIKAIKKAIQEHIDANPELRKQRDLAKSVIGIGELTAAKLLGEVRDITSFDSARQLAAYVGIAPRAFVSGSSVHKKSRISKTGNCHLRKDLYMCAIVARKHNPIIRAFCERLLAAGKSPMEVICAAMRKLLHLLYGVLKSGIPFNPDFLVKQGSTS